MRLALVVACLGACDRRTPITACGQDLSGEYVVGGGPATWMLVDQGAELEAFPMFPDVPAEGALEVAPRSITWSRDRNQLRGKVHRRYMQGAAACNGEAPATIASCNNDVLEVVLGDPTAPLGFSPCQWSRSGTTRRERWIRRP